MGSRSSFTDPREERDGVLDIAVDGAPVLEHELSRVEQDGHRLLLVGASQPARRRFEIAGIAFLLDEQEAVNVLNRFSAGTSRRSAQNGGPDA